MDVVIFDPIEEHADHLKSLCIKFCFQRNLDNSVMVNPSLNTAEANVRERDLTCVCMFGVLPELYAAAGRIRAKKEQDYLVLVGDDAEELLPYVTPVIRPAGLLTRPADKAELYGLLDAIEADCAASGDGERFAFKIQASLYSVATGQIVFFEAADKKVKIRTKAQEFEFYDSLSNIEKKLPPEFLRIHKSFLVNTKRIVNADFANMSVAFDEGSTAYISRTRKAALKAVMEAAE